MSDISEVVSLIQKQGENFQEFKAAQSQRFKTLEDELREVSKKAGRPSFAGASDGNDDHTKAFISYLRTGREIDLHQKTMSIGSDPDGGYLVPTELDRELTKYLRARSPMRQLARVVPVSGAEYKQPASTGGTGYSWVGESQPRPETASPSLKMVTIPTHEVYASPATTTALLDDNTFDLGNWLVEELADAFGDAEGAAFINGDGVARPRGLFTYDVESTADATRANAKFQYIATGGAGAFAATAPADALISLVYAVKAQYRANASWLMSPEVVEQVRKFKGVGTNDYLWQPATAAGQPATLLGYPVYEDENVALIGAGSLSAAFGDFSRAYTITDRSTALIRDNLTNKPFVNFYATKRLGGGGGRDTRAVKFLKFAAS